ncbi:hypothetical protein PFISCL1PPCAC_24798, partial [Pristionchus fissidentatus]
SIALEMVEKEESPLLLLPTEIIFKIFSFLDIPDRLKMREVNRKLRSIGNKTKFPIRFANRVQEAFIDPREKSHYFSSWEKLHPKLEDFFLDSMMLMSMMFCVGSAIILPFVVGTVISENVYMWYIYINIALHILSIALYWIVVGLKIALHRISERCRVKRREEREIIRLDQQDA